MAKAFWSLAFIRECPVSKANLSASSTSSCSECPSPWYVFLSTMILGRSLKARIACSYCSTVFSPSSVCLLRHSVALGAFRRNQSAASFFRGFCCGLFRGPFACVLLGFLTLEPFDEPDGSCDLGSCNGCDGSGGSGCCDDCDGS